MLCIRCETEMQKSIFEGVLIDFCPECKSFWLDKEEFENAVKKQEFNSSALVAEARHEAIAEITRKVEWAGENICPKCMNGKLQKFDMFGVDVDKCETCEGVFFDKGEFQKCYEQATEGFFAHMWRHMKDIM